MAEASGLMRGKRGLVMGVANNRSIAWGIAKACHGAGAELAFTYQGDALKRRVEPLAQEVGGLVVGHCDVTQDETIDSSTDAISTRAPTTSRRRCRSAAIPSPLSPSAPKS
jgi:enoyl-[acyl-carrier protein] reductase I